MRQHRRILVGTLILGCIAPVLSWGNNNNNNNNENSMSVYGNSLDRDWLYNSNTISLQLEGCMWGYVEDNEDSGCMEDESEDGTSYWYQMANCRRAQAVFSIYASSGGSKCKDGNFKETVRLVNGCEERLLLTGLFSLSPRMEFPSLCII